LQRALLQSADKSITIRAGFYRGTNLRKTHRGEKKGKAAAPALHPSKRNSGKRLAPRLRAEQILRGAVRFFAEHGFGGQTRELANELGISKGLLYRYFPSKEALIERIYEEVFLRRWSPQWQSILTDRSRPLIERLKVFYVDYARLPLEYEWGRIYLHAGLAGASINRRYARLAHERVFKPVIGELRREFGAPPIEAMAITEPESELMWSLHGSIFYIGIRKWVYHVPVPADIDAAIEQLVDGFYASAKNVIGKAALSRDRWAEESGSRTHQRPAAGLSRI
jgi:AcrR family transcriptional regulator